MNRLYRSRRDRVLLGVCGGIARYFRVDPVLVRVMWVLISLGPFPGIIAYVLAAILMPEEPQAAEGATAGPAGGEESPGQRERTVKLLGWGLVALGAALLVHNWAVMAGAGRWLGRLVPFTWDFWWGFTASWWPVALIVLGAVILWRGVCKSV